MSEIKWLPCPFCGGEAKMCDTGIEPSYYWIYCKACGCKQPSSIHRESVINAWNTRKPMERIVQELEEEMKLADEEKKRCIKENPMQFDVAKGYVSGIYNAIEIVRNGGKE